ncbi:DUF1727 domain-containing protein, partial [Nocardia sp. NPDC004722]
SQERRIPASAAATAGISMQCTPAPASAATGLVIAVNGQVPDGEDLSWLWDVRFEHFEGTQVVAAGERATDLAVRLTYAGVEHITVADPLRAIASCPPGRVEVLANYTAFRDLNRDLETGTKA